MAARMRSTSLARKCFAALRGQHDQHAQGLVLDGNLANAADDIEYQYLDRERNWETQTLRVAASGVTTMLNPARITGDGVTSEAHAAVLTRYHSAQSLYQYKTIDFGADIDYLAYRRLSVLWVSYDLTQRGFGGRVLQAQRVEIRHEQRAQRGTGQQGHFHGPLGEGAALHHPYHLV